MHVGGGSVRGRCCAVASYLYVSGFEKRGGKNKNVMWFELLVVAVVLARTLRDGAATFFSYLLQPLKHADGDAGK